MCAWPKLLSTPLSFNPPYLSLILSFPLPTIISSLSLSSLSSIYRPTLLRSNLFQATMFMAQEDVCDTGLTLSLGISSRTPSTHHQHNIGSSASNPSLTLSLSEDASKPARLSSPHSTVSSFSTVYPLSIKREKDMALDEAEAAASYRASDDDEDGGARKKLRLTKDQSALLEERFKEHSTLNPKQKQALAKQLNLRPRQVEVWFQNRRARTKLKQNEVDCEFLKRCCETLTDENRRLQKEVQELRALKLAPPPHLYMQIPAATLTMCPSCERIGGASEGAKGATAGGPFVLSAKPRFFSSFNHPAAC